jgi:outer membrane lipoprotein SlyB
MSEWIRKGKTMEQNKTHPLVLTAAGAVIASSALAVAVLTGVLPSAVSKSADTAAQVAQAPAPDRSAPARQAFPRRAACPACGVVESIRVVEVQGEASGVGAVAGGVTGAVVGNQFGHGGGRTAMTILGAAGGAYAGNAIEKNVKKGTAWRVTVRMDDGSYRTVSMGSQPELAVGSHVRVVNGSTLERA